MACPCVARLVHLLATLGVGLLDVELEDLCGLRRNSTGNIGRVARHGLLGLEFYAAHMLVKLDWIDVQLVVDQPKVLGGAIGRSRCVVPERWC